MKSIIALSRIICSVRIFYLNSIRAKGRLIPAMFWSAERTHLRALAMLVTLLDVCVQLIKIQNLQSPLELHFYQSDQFLANLWPSFGHFLGSNENLIMQTLKNCHFPVHNTSFDINSAVFLVTPKGSRLHLIIPPPSVLTYNPVYCRRWPCNSYRHTNSLSIYTSFV